GGREPGGLPPGAGRRRGRAARPGVSDDGRRLPRGAQHGYDVVRHGPGRAHRLLRVRLGRRGPARRTERASRGKGAGATYSGSPRGEVPYDWRGRQPPGALHEGGEHIGAALGVSAPVVLFLKSLKPVEKEIASGRAVLVVSVTDFA